MFYHLEAGWWWGSAQFFVAIFLLLFLEPGWGWSGARWTGSAHKPRLDLQTEGKSMRIIAKFWGFVTFCSSSAYHCVILMVVVRHLWTCGTFLAILNYCTHLVANDHPLAVVRELFVVGAGVVPTSSAWAHWVTSPSVWGTEADLNRQDEI